jgi:homoserine acetyltransferase
LAGGNSNGNSHWLLPMWKRRQEALELRKAGLTYTEIASTVGYHGHTAAYKAVKAALLETIREPAEEVRRLAPP